MIRRVSKNPVKPTKKEDPLSVKPFHEMFPFALEWFVKDGKKKLQHNAYFPYDDYRERYYKQYKSDKSLIGVRKYKTKPRTD
jgi:hypothetical protein